jgi:hypothetical protein
MSKKTVSKKTLSAKQTDELFSTLKARFEKNMNRHKGIEWAKVQAKLEENPDKLCALNEMERTGGEPDVIAHDKRRATTFSMIVQRKLPKNAGVFVTTAKRLRQGKNINQKTAPLIWRLRSASSS